MSVSYHELTNLEPGGFADASASLSKAAKKLATEYVQYKASVLAPVRAGDDWSGGGQEDASAVVEVNGLAIDTMRLRAATGAAAYLYGNIGFAAAQRRLTALKIAVKGDNMLITEAGRVQKYWDTEIWTQADQQRCENYQAELDNIVDDASVVDDTVAGSLNASHDPPAVGLTNHPGLLDKARQDHRGAKADATRMVTTLETLAAKNEVELEASITDLGLPDLDRPRPQPDDVPDRAPDRQDHTPDPPDVPPAVLPVLPPRRQPAPDHRGPAARQGEPAPSGDYTVTTDEYTAVFELDEEDDFHTVDDVDVIVTLPDGSRWTATFMTQEAVARLWDHSDSTYFHRDNLILTREPGVPAMVDVVQRLVDGEGQRLEDVFEPLPDDIDTHGRCQR